MEIRGLGRRTLTAAAPAVGGKSAGKTMRTAAADSVVISSAGRQAVLEAAAKDSGSGLETEAKVQQPVIDRETGAMFQGIDWDSVDWDSFELPKMHASADHQIYWSAYMEASGKYINDIHSRIRAHYQPAFEKIKNMDVFTLNGYLYETYKKPYQAWLFQPGTDLPQPPDGMSKEEADMAYRQLRCMYFGVQVQMDDVYALGEEGLREVSTITQRAEADAAKVYDAAQKELDEKNEALDKQRKEDFRRMIGAVREANVFGKDKDAALCAEGLALPVQEDPKE